MFGIRVNMHRFELISILLLDPPHGCGFITPKRMVKLVVRSMHFNYKIEKIKKTNKN